jgi:hypothetical protein
MAVIEGDLAKPGCLDQIGNVARLKLDVHEIGLRPSEIDQLIGARRQGGDVRVYYLRRARRTEGEAIQPGGWTR